MSTQSETEKMIARIDERTMLMKETLDKIPEHYVTVTRFKPVELITYGLVGSILITILMQIVATVIK